MAPKEKLLADEQVVAAVCISSFDTERNKDESPIRDHLYHFPSDAIHTWDRQYEKYGWSVIDFT